MTFGRVGSASSDEESSGVAASRRFCADGTARCECYVSSGQYPATGLPVRVAMQADPPVMPARPRRGEQWETDGVLSRNSFPEVPAGRNHKIPDRAAYSAEVLVP